MDLSRFTPPQQAAIRHLDGPLLICAGAGSGKTFTLTQRITYALLPGSGEGGRAFLDGIDQALVITFTNKAAGEIKGRIRAQLAAEGLADQTLAVDDAWISTIHGMCNRMLREHALELGLDPAFELAIGTDTEEAQAQAIEQTIRLERQARAEGRGRFDALFDAFRDNPDRIREMTREVLNQAACQTDGLEAFDLGPAPASPSVMVRDLLNACAEADATGTEANREEAAALADRLAQLLDAPAGPTHAALAEAVGSVNLRRLGKRVADLNAAVKQARAAAALAALHLPAQQLIAFAREVDAVYRRLLAARGLLDTSDLIRTTLRAFREHPGIARSYTERFRLIMVDEFQDTSQLQIDMIEQIAGPAREHLCTVGDSQQSIYRFQGADVAVYLRHKRDMLATRPAPARREELGQNFRSHGDVLAFVRSVCGRDGYFPEAFLDLQAATQGRPWHGTGPRVEVALTCYGQDGVTSADATRAEARHFARRFAELRDAGHAPSEMVLLMGATTGAAEYAQAIREQGLACVVSGGSKFFQAAHVQAALALLKCLANPYDSENLLQVLTGPALPVQPDDLLLLSTYRSDETGRPTRQNPAVGLLLADRAPDAAEASPLLAHAVRVLRRAWGSLGRVEPGALFRQAVVESGWLSRMEAAGAEGQAQAADVLKFARLVDEAAADGLDVPQVAARLERQAATGAEKPGALSADGLDAVRIMTVHASKGLQFPIVAIANCLTTTAGGAAPATAAEDGRVYAALVPPKFADEPVEPAPGALAAATDAVAFASLIRETNAQREYEERKRLFYVAATRASAGLIVGMKHRVLKDDVFRQVEGDLLAGLCPGAAAFPDGSTTIEYGGSEPLAFTRVEAASAEPDDAPTPAESPDATFTVPRVNAGEPPIARTARPMPLRTGLFSYTSLAAAGDAGEGIALPQAAPLPDERGTDERGTGCCSKKNNNPSPVHPSPAPAGPPHDVLLDEGDDVPAPRAVRAFTADADKATDFGSALHQLCEWLALQPGPDPDEASLQAAVARFAASWHVTDVARLRAAFDRWRASDARAEALAFAHRQPELPFCLATDRGVLEGEIDLLCWSDERRALIVDYKTGGSADETPQHLRDKHELQARCYALAAMRAGFAQVEALFVRVEQPDPADPRQPQTVRFTFDVTPTAGLL